MTEISRAYREVKQKKDRICILENTVSQMSAAAQRAKPARTTGRGSRGNGGGGENNVGRRTTKNNGLGCNRPSIRRIGEARSHSRERLERLSRQQSLLGQNEFTLYM